MMVSPRFVLVTAVSVLVCLTAAGTVAGSVSAAPPGRPDVTRACGDPLSASEFIVSW